MSRQLEAVPIDTGRQRGGVRGKRSSSLYAHYNGNIVFSKLASELMGVKKGLPASLLHEKQAGIYYLKMGEGSIFFCREAIGRYCLRCTNWTQALLNGNWAATFDVVATEDPTLYRLTPKK